MTDLNTYCRLLLLVLHTAAFGQTDSVSSKIRKNSIQVDLGFAHSRLINEGFTQSKLLFRGTNFKARLGYGRQSINSLFSFSTEIIAGSIGTKQNDLTVTFASIKPTLDYLHKITSYTFLKKANDFFAGLQLSSINILMENEPLFENIAIYSLHGIYLDLHNRFTLNKTKKLQFTYLMPMVVYGNHGLWTGRASNLTYSDENNVAKLLSEHGQFLYFNLLSNIQFKVDYCKDIGKGVDLTATYTFIYTNTDVVAPFRIYSNELLVGLRFNF